LGWNFCFFYLLEKLIPLGSDLSSHHAFEFQHIFKALWIFVLVSIAWVFFRSQSIAEAFHMIGNIFEDSSPQNVLQIRPVLWVMLSFFIFSDLLLYNSRFDKFVEKLPWPLRWLNYAFLIFAIISFSAVDHIPFIYFQFLIVKEFAKIGVRIIALILILLLCNWLYVEFFFEKDLEKHSSIIYKIRALDADTDILYLGESSNKTFDTNDLDRRKISQMLSEFYPDLKIRDITEPAAHLGIYYEILRKIPGDSNVKTVVVTLNLRSFGLDWIHSKLESSLQKSLLLLKPYPPLVNRFLLSFKAYPSYNEEERTKTIRRLWQEEAFDTLSGMPYSSVSEWDRAMSRKGIRDTLGRYDQAMTELACHYIKSYAFTMNKHYRIRIQDMDRIITLAKKRNWHLVFNLMAENVDKAELLVGEDLLSLMRENRDYLVTYLGERSISVADNLEAVEDKEFIDQDWTTEHYKQKGRRIIARNLAKELKPFYAENYAESANDYTSPF
jgi:hypothetical protein